MKRPGIVCWTQRFGTLPSADVWLVGVAPFADDAGPVDFKAVSSRGNCHIEVTCCGRKVDAILIFLDAAATEGAKKGVNR